MNRKNPVQKRFIQQLKDTIPSNLSLANELTDLLGLSSDSAYRRIRCETSFTMDELTKICDHYRISFDTFCAIPEGGVTFKYSIPGKSPEDFSLYLSNILADLQQIKQMPQKSIYYAAVDIPLFHLFRYPVLSTFKFYYWMRSVIGQPELEGKPYLKEAVPVNIQEKGLEILSVYNDIPSVEIWNDRTISGLMKQIFYYHEAGLFTKKEDGLEICEALKNLLYDIQRMAAQEYKDNPNAGGSYNLYCSDIEIGNNCIFAKSETAARVYLNHHTFNFMHTGHDRFCSETEEWFSGLMRKSNLISGSSEKIRYQFFRKMNDEINDLMREIER
jgi:hypothetical protein